MRPKMVYLAKRRPDTDHRAFLENWAGHAELSAQFPQLARHFRRVIQCDAQPPGETVPGVSDEYDGVNLLGMRAVASMSEVWQDPAVAATMEPDELRVFDGYVRGFTVQCVEEVVVDGPYTEHLAIRFVARRADTDRLAFVSRWSAAGARVLSEIDDAPGRIVHNHRMFPAPPGFEYDGVEELWFDSAEQRRAFFLNPRVTQEWQEQESVVNAAGSVTVFADVCLAVPPLHR